MITYYFPSPTKFHLALQDIGILFEGRMYAAIGGGLTPGEAIALCAMEQGDCFPMTTSQSN